MLRCIGLRRPLLEASVGPLCLVLSALVLAAAAHALGEAVGSFPATPLRGALAIILVLVGASALLIGIRMLGEVATIVYGLAGHRHVRRADIAAIRDNLQAKVDPVSAGPAGTVRS
jgi:hypothetical protein